MAVRNDRVYNRLDEIGENQLINNGFIGTQNFLLDGTGGAGSPTNVDVVDTVGGGGGGSGNILAFDPYTSPYIKPRRVFFTINTYASLSRNGVLAKAFIDGIEVEDQTNSKGRITFSLDEQRLLNPSTLTLVSGDLKPTKYFIIQSRKDVQNEISIIEYDNSTNTPSPIEGTPISNARGFGGNEEGVAASVIGGGSAQGSGGGASGFVERDFGTGFGRERVVDGDLADRRNIQ